MFVYLPFLSILPMHGEAVSFYSRLIPSAQLAPEALSRRALTMLSPNLLLKGLPPSLSPSQPIGPPPLMLGPQHRAPVTALPCPALAPAYTRYWVLPALGPLHLLNSVLGTHVIKLPLGLGPLSVCRDTEERVVGGVSQGPRSWPGRPLIAMPLPWALLLILKMRGGGQGVLKLGEPHGRPGFNLRGSEEVGKFPLGLLGQVFSMID